jgi:hypothetical protein
MSCTPDAHLFHLIFRPTMRLVTVVRKFVCELFGELFYDTEVTASVAMAAYELLENTVKYSLDDTSRLTIQVDEDASGRRVVVETSNASKPSDAARVEALVRRMAGEDPMQEYVALMEETVRCAEGSGLGLARLRAEAGLRMSCRLEGCHLVIAAEMFIPASTA